MRARNSQFVFILGGLPGWAKWLILSSARSGRVEYRFHTPEDVA
jgi:hypothetical protein